MFKTSKRRSSYLTGGGDRMLCCKVMWMLKSNILAQCAHLSVSLFVEGMGSLEAELLVRDFVTNRQKHYWHVGITSCWAAGRRLGMVSMLVRAVAVRCKGAMAAFIPQCVIVEV